MKQRYRDKSGHSGVTHFDAGQEGFIKVWFRGGDCYLYSSVVPGVEEVAAMKERAVAGEGLSTYISQHVRGRYAAVIRA